MEKINNIVKTIEEFAPLSLACPWDNSGWQILLGDKNINKVILALTPTLDVINKAVNNKYELLITHHPLLFSKLNKINIDDPLQQTIINAIQNNLSVYSAHTNLDSTKNGIADVLAEKLNLQNIRPIEEVAEDSGLGRIGELIQEKNINILIEELKKILKTDKLKLINPSNKTKIKTVALCPGAGSDFIFNTKDIDLYISSDIKFHNALEVSNNVVIDAGHFETERIILPVLKQLIESKHDVIVDIAEEKKPWVIV